MLLPLKAIILKAPRRDGNHLIYFQYCYTTGKRVLISTEIAIPSNCWNKKRQIISQSLPASFGDAEHLNSELKRMYKVAERIIEHGTKANIDNFGEYLKGVFTPSFDPDTLPELAAVVIKERTRLFCTDR